MVAAVLTPALLTSTPVVGLAICACVPAMAVEFHWLRMMVLFHLICGTKPVTSFGLIVSSGAISLMNLMPMAPAKAGAMLPVVPFAALNPVRTSQPSGAPSLSLSTSVGFKGGTWASSKLSVKPSPSVSASVGLLVVSWPSFKPSSSVSASLMFVCCVYSCTAVRPSRSRSVAASAALLSLRALSSSHQRGSVSESASAAPVGSTSQAT